MARYTRSRSTRRRAVGSREVRVRATAVATLSGVLILGASALGGLFAAEPATAIAPTSGWTAAASTSPAGPDTAGSNPNDTWSSVSCVSAAFCAGAGYYTGNSTNLPLLGVEVDGTWSTLEAPVPANADSPPPARLDAVSCAAVGVCVAVGFYAVSGTQHALIETLSGGRWTAQDAPVPPDAATGSNFGAFLQSVDCPTPEACAAVGNYRATSPSGGQFGLLETETNGAWSAQAAPQPSAAAADQQVNVSSVSCPGLGPCAATGSYQTGTFPSVSSPFLLRASTDGSWTAADAPLPAGSGTGNNSFSQLSDISCATSCEAVGQVELQTGQFVGLLEQLSSGIWTPSLAPDPSNAGTQGAGLNGVSCTFDGICTAVGSYNDQAGGGQPLIETINGTAVTATEGPQPDDTATGSGSAGTLNAISCLSATTCAAVGFYRNDTNSGMDVALTLDSSGGTWSAPAIAMPANAGAGSSASSILSSVSCSSRGACDAVGNYADTAQNGFGLVESFVPAGGYWSVASDGGIFNYGVAGFYGSTGGQRLAAPMVGMAETPGGGGYWEVAADGGIFNYGNAPYDGSAGNVHLNAPIVGMAATPDGGGYWLVASDGGIFNYGDAGFHGSAGSLPLDKPIVGMAATPDGGGYWLVASDGGIFSYGDASFYGSRGGQPLNQPVVGMVPSASGLGYWLVASDGGIFSYGDAGFLGSRGGQPLNKPIVAIMSTFDGAGYWLVASDGGIFSYGATGFYGSAGSLKLNAPVVSGTAS
jgi:hypothetical protein